MICLEFPPLVSHVNSDDTRTIFMPFPSETTDKVAINFVQLDWIMKWQPTHPPTPTK